VTSRNRAFFAREICGQFVVKTWLLCGLLLAGTDEDKAWSEFGDLPFVGLRAISSEAATSSSCQAPSAALLLPIVLLAIFPNDCARNRFQSLRTGRVTNIKTSITIWNAKLLR
jgi:hypothetical protein